MVLINKPDNIDFKYIRFKKPFNIFNHTYKIDIKYNIEETIHPLIVQTPKLYIPFGVSTFGLKKYIDVSLGQQEDNQEFLSFYNFIKKFNKLIRKYNVKLPELISNKKFISCIKPGSGIFPERLTLNLYDDISIFDLNKTPININSIKSKTHGKFIFQISHIWVNEYNWGCAFNILQIIIDPTITIKEYSFIEDDEPSKCIKDDPKYVKYFKMLSMGIPKQAIKQKIILDCLDPSIIDQDPNTKLNTKLNSNNNKDETQKPVNLLQEIKLGFALKKTEPIIKKKKFSYTNTNIHVPTLSQIKNARLSLKKINTEL